MDHLIIGLCAQAVFNLAGFEPHDGPNLRGAVVDQTDAQRLLLLVFNGPTLWGPIQAVTSDLYNGTLEYLYSNPGSRYAYYVGTVLTEVITSDVLLLKSREVLNKSQRDKELRKGDTGTTR